RWADSCHQHIAGLWPIRQPSKAGYGHFGFPRPIGNQFVRAKTKTLADLNDGTWRHGAGDVEIAHLFLPIIHSPPAYQSHRSIVQGFDSIREEMPDHVSEVCS